jgi:hypothetical protein
LYAAVRELACLFLLLANWLGQVQASLYDMGMSVIGDSDTGLDKVDFVLSLSLTHTHIDCLAHPSFSVVFLQVVGSLRMNAPNLHNIPVDFSKVVGRAEHSELIESLLQLQWPHHTTPHHAAFAAFNSNITAS